MDLDDCNLLETDKAYMAAILDGEGYITIHARKVKYGKSCQPKFMVASTSISWLKELRDKWGGVGSFFVSDERKFEEWKPFAQWCVVGKAAQQILSTVYPYLQIKKDQACAVINFKMVGQGKRRTKEELDAQVEQYNHVRKLNQRGTKEYIPEDSAEFVIH